MEPKDYFKDLFTKENKTAIKNVAKGHDRLIEQYVEGNHLKNNISVDDLKKFILGKGIASIRGTLSGLRGKDKKAYNNDSYIEGIKSNVLDVNGLNEQIRKLSEAIDIFQNNQSTEDLAKAYSDFCKKVFPTENPNNITNRFVASLFLDKMTTIVDPGLVCVVLTEGFGQNCKETDGKYWLPNSIILHNKIRTLLKDITDEVQISTWGWEMADYIQNIKKNEELFKNSHNVIFTGAPGTGKTYLAQQIARRLTNNNETHIKFVQFHPSYDYSDFVEGLRPTKECTSFEYKEGVFKKFCREALSELNKAQDNDTAPKFVFIIDEINRGEMSKIFGELFFSIDPGYRVKKADKDFIKVDTQYQNILESKIGTEDNPFQDGFFVPDNVYIIGTMNDIDRSVESMDFAMRRRFTFVEITADDRVSMLQNLDDYEECRERMERLNAAIENVEGLSSAYHIGPAYFRKISQYKTKKFENLWEFNIKGLIIEYLRGMPNAKDIMINLKKAFDSK